MRRRLDQRLYLLVKSKLAGSGSEWQFPYAQHQGEEAIRCGLGHAVRAHDVGGRDDKEWQGGACVRCCWSCQWWYWH